MHDNSSGKFCNSLIQYSRWQTRVVKVGNVLIGGGNPIVIQSMTTTDTMDTLATVEQSIRMIEAGCQLVRITAPSIKEAKNLENIKNELRKRGYDTPLVADIHFTPNAAEVAARIVEKVRINPGNYIDKKKGEDLVYTDESYNQELEKIRKKFIPLINICKEYGTALRIGTNHGSLSDRIMSRYGDTPLGMTESAMEFLRIAQEENFHNIILSMKASNPKVMVEAYRLLVKTMMENDMNYPLHLGVTEAGDGEDGRIKSAVGIGALLEDGLGDTIRVSLTEDPENEIPVAKTIVEKYIDRENHKIIQPFNPDFAPDFFEFKRRDSIVVNDLGGDNVPRVIADFSETPIQSHKDLRKIGYHYIEQLDKWSIGDMAPDYIFIGDQKLHIDLPVSLGVITYPGNEVKHLKRMTLVSESEFVNTTDLNNCCVSVNASENSPVFFAKIKASKNTILFLRPINDHAMAEMRAYMIRLNEHGINLPVVFHQNFRSLSIDAVQLFSSSTLGPLFLDGFGDGIMLSQFENCHQKELNSIAFGILQACRARISKTEYIACPSCGRTLFDLQETTALIRKRTSHLKGVKIGIMGCIVNGPGEMADADFGYVGSGVDKITLYKGREVIKRNVSSVNAVDELVQLIKDNGKWVEPNSLNLN